MIPISFWAVVRIAGATAAVLTAGLVAGWPVLIEYSVNARGYSMAALLGMVCVAVAWRIRTGSGTGWTVLILGGLGALGLWVVPTFLFVWTGILFWILLPGEHGPIWARARNAGLSGLVSGVGALPSTHRSWPPTDRQHFWPTGSSQGRPVGTSPRGGQFLTEVADRWFHAVPWAAVAVVALGFVLAAVGGAGREPRMLAWAMTGGSLLFLLVIQATPPPRSWIPLIPPALAVSAVGLAWMLEKAVREPRVSSMIAAAIGLIVAVAVGLTLSDDGTGLSAEGSGLADAPAIVMRLGELLEPGDEVVLVQRLSAPIRYHALAAGRELPSFEPRPVRQGNVFLVTGPNPRIERLLANLGLTDLGEAELGSVVPVGGDLGDHAGPVTLSHRHMIPPVPDDLTTLVRPEFLLVAWAAGLALLSGSVALARWFGRFHLAGGINRRRERCCRCLCRGLVVGPFGLILLAVVVVGR